MPSISYEECDRTLFSDVYNQPENINPIQDVRQKLEQRLLFDSDDENEDRILLGRSELTSNAGGDSTSRESSTNTGVGSMSPELNNTSVGSCTYREYCI